MKEKLLGMTPQELRTVALSCGLKPFTGSQLAGWMYRKKVTDLSSMTDISPRSASALLENFEVGCVFPSERAVSADGTVKYLFPVTTSKGAFFVEAVVIPDGDRKTLCVSCQAGCRMGCSFCMTGRQGWHGHLDAAQILSQFICIEEAAEISNAVFMGMGEPMDNYDSVMKAISVLTSEWGYAWSPKRITVSTVGVIPGLKRFLDESRCHVAVSLHNPIEEERASLMGVQKIWPLHSVISLLKQYDFSGQRRISFEYTMFSGWNDDILHADALIRLLRGLECRVNLIRFHSIPDFPYGTSPDTVMEKFRDRLNANGITCTIRASRGEDIFAACGLLAGRHAKNG